MNEMEPRKGNLVIGAMLVMVGLWIALERSGVIQWGGMWSLWPVILGGIGLARFVQTPPGEPKEGLVFMTAAAWLLVSDAGWFAWEDSWPLLVIAIGLIIAFNGGRRRRWSMPEPPNLAGQPGLPGQPAQPWDKREWRRMRRHHRSLTPLAVLGVWIAIFVGFQMSGGRTFRDGAARVAGFTETTSDRLQVVSVMGRSDHVSRATAFQGANITNVMGRADVDLRDAKLAPGASASVKVFSMMGEVVMRVPPTWTVDTGAISAMGGVQDNRPKPDETTADSPAPRLVLRGAVIMGRLTIR
jgi:cell wall-active antibiotic response 4TMS protein YvqF